MRFVLLVDVSEKPKLTPDFYFDNTLSMKYSECSFLSIDNHSEKFLWDQYAQHLLPSKKVIVLVRGDGNSKQCLPLIQLLQKLLSNDVSLNYISYRFDLPMVLQKKLDNYISIDAEEKLISELEKLI